MVLSVIGVLTFPPLPAWIHDTKFAVGRIMGVNLKIQLCSAGAS